jgi:hypothetical protein
VKTRYIAALAVSGLAAAIVAPNAAYAATASGSTHIASGSAARPSAAVGKSNAFQKNVVHSRPSATVNGLTAALVATESGAESFAFDATGSSDTATGATITGYSIDFGDGSTPQTGTSGTFNYKYAWAGTYTATVTVTDSAATTSTATVTITTGGSDYTPYGPTRILDTRNGTGAPAAAVGPNGVLKLTVAGAGTAGNLIPAGVTAVAMNVTVTAATRAGFITAYPDGTAAPTASNINYGTGQTIPNLVIVQVGANGVVDLQNSSAGSVQLVADVVGYYAPTKASQYVSISPYRLLDTRNGTGTSGVVKKIPANSSITVPVGGADGNIIPASGVTAIAANITATNPGSNGFITAYPSGESLPNASNVNYGHNQTVANMADVPVGSNGNIVIHNTSSSSVDVVIDVSGYFTDLVNAGTGVATDSYLAIPPQRWLDTRTPSWGYGPLKAYYYYYGIGAYSTDSGITSIVMNATVTNTQHNGFLTLYPVNTQTYSDVPNSSNLNFAAGQTVANLAFVPLGTTPLGDGSSPSDGFTGYWYGANNNSNGSTDLVLDYEGLFFNN